VFNKNAGFWWFADKILSSLSCSTGDNETRRKPALLLTRDRYRGIIGKHLNLDPVLLINNKKKSND